ncbi:DNA translocase FtsK [Nocardia pseudovaccinii]|uniref:DNA translocase FtsK n=1 Tax=Nocardia pseudovaccinii TaxID=189540 RepID=UPI0007A506AE|nr:DNA translocase FtsK [Nocardia pseudovaccinii]
MTSTTITVGTADLRQALTAVLPHAGKDKDLPEYSRVRLTVDREHVTVSATDRITMALAIVSIWEDAAHEPCVVELLPEDAKKLLTVFKAGKADQGDPEYRLRLDIDAERLTVTDCSGMDMGIDGRSLRIPRLPTGDVLGVVAGTIALAHDGQAALLLDMSVSGEKLARFKTAATTYESLVSVEARGERMVLIRCGESFLGLMLSRKLDEDDIKRAREHARSWSERLPDILAAGKVEQGDVADQERYRHAVELVVTTQFGSASMVQRRLGIGYARARALIERMEEDGIVGPTKVGGGTRDVLVSADGLSGLLEKLGITP